MPKVSPEVRLMNIIQRCRCTITSSISMDVCWSCNSALPLEVHHVIPRAFGGENGPTVTICTSCHTKAHHLGLKLFGSDADIGVKPRLLYLGACIALAAYKAMGGNKRIKYSGSLKYEDHLKLKVVQRDLGFRSQQDTLIYCLERVYKSLRGGDMIG